MAMRVLFTCHPGAGTFHPLVPIAQATVAAGHEVAFATAPHYTAPIEQVGFEAFPMGLGFEARRAFFALPGAARQPHDQMVYWIIPNLFIRMQAVNALPDL